ncbi:MAG TPA: flagellar biosynthetic protein FliQ [Acidobacteriaceae bacterium]
MTADQVAELMRMTLREALVLSAPILVIAGVSSLLISLAQTLTSIQDQTLSTVPRLLIVLAVIMAGMPWFLHRLVWFTASLLSDLQRFAS